VLRDDPCAYCGAPADTIDHIDPLAWGGNNGWENLTAACGSCNGSKHGSRLLVFLHRRAAGSRDVDRNRKPDGDERLEVRRVERP
jgi:5-methylcytosine-specific restriction endonuclease McrA